MMRNGLRRGKKKKGIGAERSITLTPTRAIGKLTREKEQKENKKQKEINREQTPNPATLDNLINSTPTTFRDHTVILFF